MPGEVGEVVLFWPAVAVLGFFVLAALVIALGTSSTARYQFERNQVQRRVAVPAMTVETPAGDGPGVRPGGDAPRADAGGAVGQDGCLEQGTAVGLAMHPAGKRAVGSGAAPAWWLVDEWADRPGDRIVAGPFADRIDADWAALSGGLPATVRTVHGAQRTDGGLVRRQLPQERAWLSELGEQLDRLAEEWNGLLSDDDALTTLVVEVTAALVEAGLPLHDCDGRGSAGGVCLTPVPGQGGILVSWHQHDRMSRQQVRGAATDAAVQQTMNAAIADLLTQLGFRVESAGAAGCSLVLDVRG